MQQLDAMWTSFYPEMFSWRWCCEKVILHPFFQTLKQTQNKKYIYKTFVFAFRTNNYAVLNALLQHSFIKNTTGAMQYICMNHQYLSSNDDNKYISCKCVKLLLDDGHANVNGLCNTSVHYNYMSPLMILCKNKAVCNCVHRLLEHPLMNTDLVDLNGDTALHHAVGGSSPTTSVLFISDTILSQLLQKCGRSPYIRNNNGNFPLVHMLLWVDNIWTSHSMQSQKILQITAMNRIECIVKAIAEHIVNDWGVLFAMKATIWCEALHCMSSMKNIFFLHIMRLLWRIGFHLIEYSPRGLCINGQFPIERAVQHGCKDSVKFWVHHMTINRSNLLHMGGEPALDVVVRDKMWVKGSILLDYPALNIFSSVTVRNFVFRRNHCMYSESQFRFWRKLVIIWRARVRMRLTLVLARIVNGTTTIPQQLPSGSTEITDKLSTLLHSRPGLWHAVAKPIIQWHTCLTT